MALGEDNGLHPSKQLTSQEHPSDTGLELPREGLALRGLGLDTVVSSDPRHQAGEGIHAVWPQARSGFPPGRGRCV